MPRVLLLHEMQGALDFQNLQVKNLCRFYLIFFQDNFEYSEKGWRTVEVSIYKTVRQKVHVLRLETHKFHI